MNHLCVKMYTEGNHTHLVITKQTEAVAKVLEKAHMEADGIVFRSVNMPQVLGLNLSGKRKNVMFYLRGASKEFDREKLYMPRPLARRILRAVETLNGMLIEELAKKGK